jgi:universal stress protein A
MSATYPQILLAVDLLPDSAKLVEKAKKVANSQNAKLTLLHVVEASPITDHLYVDQNEFKQQATEKALHKLKHLDGESDAIVEIGTARKKIIETANKLNSDLIIVGSHGMHGLRALLGSTCNAILHSAKRDVLVIYYG